MAEVNRRRAMLLLTAAFAAGGLVACKEKTGPEPIHFDRETCEICNMIISDPRFAAEVRDPEGKMHKFDDIGDAIHWLKRQPFADDPKVELWVMDMRDGKTWLDARKAWYLPNQVSPMDYGFGAIAEKEKGAVDFAAMKKAVIARGLSSRCDFPGGHQQEPAAHDETGKKK